MSSTSTTTPTAGADDGAPDPASALDNPAWSALTGPHAHLAIGDDLVRHYPRDVSMFVGVRSWHEPGVWDALVRHLPGERVGISFTEPVPLPAWEVLGRGGGVQLVETDRLETVIDDEAVELGDADVPEMLALVARNEPGPFLPRTHTMGRYIGIRRDGRLVAMAGERLHPQGWTEISAVATDADHRGQGIATRLVRDVAHHIRLRGDRAMMHAAANNVRAIELYERLGFDLRRRTEFVAVQVPTS